MQSIWRSWRVSPLVEVDPAEVEEVAREVEDAAHTIFNNDETAVNDGLRRQLLLPDPRAPVTSALARRVRGALAQMGVDGLRATALWSEAGCQQQRIHTDYDGKTVEQLVSEGVPRPQVLVMGLMPGTRLVVRNRSVDIPPGHVLCMDGDVPHAGAAYSDSNVRLHFYQHTDRRLDARGRTFLV
jgi:hypothetical protein